MKITQRQLRRIIKEEKAKVLAEQKIRRIVRRRLLEAASPDDYMGVLKSPSGAAARSSELLEKIAGKDIVVGRGKSNEVFMRIEGEKGSWNIASLFAFLEEHKGGGLANLEKAANSVEMTTPAALGFGDDDVQASEPDILDLPWAMVSDPEIEGVIDAATAAGATLSGEIVDENTVDELEDLDALGKAFKVQKKINHETEDASGTIEIGTINGESIAAWSVMGYSVWIR